MIAIIYDRNTESTYVSPIFAIRNGWDFIAFNADRTAVKLLKNWQSAAIYVVEQTDGEFDRQNRKWRGYEWVIGNKKLRKSIKRGKSASVEEFPEFKKYTDEIILPEWFEVKTDSDIQTLIDLADLIDGEGEIKDIIREGSAILMRVKTLNGSYVNIRLTDIFEESPAGSMDHIAGIGIERGEGGFSFIYGDKQIRCCGILWNIEIITVPYLRIHRNYPDISALFEDISLYVDNAELIDRKLVINGKDKIEAELQNGEYIITVNGKMEKGSVEDQDIYCSLLEYTYGGLHTPTPLPIWQFSHSRFISLLNGIKNALIPALFAVLGFVGALTSESKVGLVVCSCLSGIPSFVALVIFGISLEAKISYEIHDTAVIINKPAAMNILPYNVIEDAALKPSRIFKNRGTVKIKTDLKTYYFRFVKGAEEAYRLIRGKINKDVF